MAEVFSTVHQYIYGKCFTKHISPQGVANHRFKSRVTFSAELNLIIADGKFFDNPKITCP